MGAHFSDADHFIYGLKPDGSTSAYVVKKRDCLNHRPNQINIWALKRQVPAFDSFLNLWGRGRLSKNPESAKGWLDGIFQQIEDQCPPVKLELQRAATVILMLASMAYLARLKQHLEVFNPCLTPQYRVLMKTLDFSLAPRAELIFHGCHPDVYLWIPKMDRKIDQVIVCFGTRKNTLNAPRPLVHFELAKPGVALMYVGHRPQSDPAKGLLGHDLGSSAKLLTSLAHEHGLHRFYGLGTSLGGYTALHYASLMNFERVLNYSGASDSFCDPMSQKGAWLNQISYPQNRVLSILSEGDRTDAEILRYYTERNFKTLVERVTTPSHGSLTAAIVEKKFQANLAWLTGERT